MIKLRDPRIPRIVAFRFSRFDGSSPPRQPRPVDASGPAWIGWVLTPAGWVHACAADAPQKVYPLLQALVGRRGMKSTQVLKAGVSPNDLYAGIHGPTRRIVPVYQTRRIPGPLTPVGRPKHSSKRTPEMDIQVRTLHLEGVCVREIGRRLQVPHQSINRWLRKMGLKEKVR